MATGRNTRIGLFPPFEVPYLLARLETIVSVLHCQRKKNAMIKTTRKPTKTYSAVVIGCIIDIQIERFLALLKIYKYETLYF
jgi:hypothetical protein